MKGGFGDLKTLNTNIAKIRDKNNNWSSIPALKGESAYELAVKKGFEGSEDDFNNSLVKKEEIDKINETLKKEIAAKVGYSEVVGNQLLMYTDDTKEKLLATLELPSGVEDVQIDGTSIVENGIAKIQLCTKTKDPGLIAIDIYSNNGGLYRANYDTGLIRVAKASNNSLDERKNEFCPVVPANLDYAVKSAMCDGKGVAWTDEEQAVARERMGTWITIADITLEEDVSMIEQIDIHGYRKYEIIVTLPSVIKTDCFIQPRICSVTGQTTSMAYESAKNAQFLLFEIEEFFYCGGENYATFIGCESYKGEVGAVTPGNKKYSSVMFNYNNKEVYPYIASVGLIANGAVFPSGSRIAIRGCD